MKILKQILRTIFIFALCKSCFAQTNQYPFQNPNLPAEERISNVISLMTLDEKINSLHFGAGVLRLGIPPMNSVEGLHGEELGGPARASRSATPTTIFPQEIGLGETWDPEILRQAAAVEGYEARYAEQSEKYHKGGLVIFSPNSDLGRDPRWGRTEECYGEDPFSTEPWSSRSSRACKATTRAIGKVRRC